MAAEIYSPIHTNPDSSNRISIPRHIVERISWLRGENPIAAWILLISPGRYRILSDEQVRADSYLEPIRKLLIEGKAEILAEPSEVLENAESASVVRLLPTTITPPGPLWRIVLPKTIEALAPPDCKCDKVTILLAAEGHWEIWLTDILRRAVSVQLSELR